MPSLHWAHSVADQRGPLVVRTLPAESKMFWGVLMDQTRWVRRFLAKL